MLLLMLLSVMLWDAQVKHSLGRCEDRQHVVRPWIGGGAAVGRLLGPGTHCGVEDRATAAEKVDKFGPNVGAGGENLDGC